MRQKISEDGSGGIIGVSKAGEVAFSFNTYRMAWAIRTQDKIQYGIDPGLTLEHDA